jgi:ribosomal protein S4
MSEGIQELQEQTPLADEKVAKELTAEEKDLKLAEMSAQSFFAGDKALRKTTLSRGAVIRALRAALHEDLTNVELKLIDDQEKRLAVMLYEMLTARTIMQAQLIKNNKTNEGVSNEQSSNEEASIISESKVV